MSGTINFDGESMMKQRARLKGPGWMMVALLVLTNAFLLWDTPGVAAHDDPDYWPGVCRMCAGGEGEDDFGCCRTTVCTDGHQQQGEQCCTWGNECPGPEPE